MPVYRLQTGWMKGGAWTHGSYGDDFAAPDLQAAKREADRRLTAAEIKGFETGDAVRIEDALGNTVWRPLKGHDDNASWS